MLNIQYIIIDMDKEYSGEARTLLMYLLSWHCTQIYPTVLDNKKISDALMFTNNLYRPRFCWIDNICNHHIILYISKDNDYEFIFLSNWIKGMLSSTLYRNMKFCKRLPKNMRENFKIKYPHLL